MSDYITQYFRCPEDYVNLAPYNRLTGPVGYFRFGEGILYGRCSGHRVAASPTEPLHDTMLDAAAEHGTISLPFDANEIVKNLTQELYSHSNGSGPVKLSSPANRLYYLVRPALPVFQ